MKPPGWGNDPLTALMETARNNQFVTFVNHPFAARLVEVDGLIERAFKDAINPRPRVPMLFALRAHSAWRAAASLAMAGQVHEAHVLIRSVLELMAYGAYIGDDPERLRLWSSRSEGNKARQRVRDEFTQGRVRAFLSTLSGPLADDYATLYERAIDLGAHPNQLGFYGSLNMRRDGSDTKFEQAYLHGEGTRLSGGLLAVVQVGMWLLSIGHILWPERFELLGVRAALEELRRHPITMGNAT